MADRINQSTDEQTGNEPKNNPNNALLDMSGYSGQSFSATYPQNILSMSDKYSKKENPSEKRYGDLVVTDLANSDDDFFS